MYNRFIRSSFYSLPLFFYHLNKKPCQTKRLLDTTLHTFAREGLFLQLSWEYGEQITYSSKDHGFQ